MDSLHRQIANSTDGVCVYLYQFLRVGIHVGIPAKIIFVGDVGCVLIELLDAATGSIDAAGRR